MPHGVCCPGDAINWEHSLNRKLGAWWLRLPEQPAGVIMRDLCGRVHGTLTNGPTWRSTSEGFGAVAYDGSNDVVASDVLPFGATPTTDYALSCVVYPRATTGEEVYFGYGFDIGFGGGIFIECESGNWKVALPSVARLDTGVAVVTGAWYHALATRRGGTHYFYLNGVKYTLGNNNPASTSDGTWTRLLMGAQAHNGNRPANAIIGSCRWWNRLVTDEDAAEDFRQAQLGWPDLLNWTRLSGTSTQVVAGGTSILRQMMQHYYGGAA